MKNKGQEIVEHYESCFDRFGDTARGVDWPNEADARKRYEVMTGLFDRRGPESVSLLDYGCGLGHYYSYLKNDAGIANLEYCGIDASPRFVDHCRAKFPGVDFETADVLEGSLRKAPLSFDYAVLNGVFTEKRGLSQDVMNDILHEVLRGVFPLCRRGLAFNVMSKIVDWERDDLFHLDFELMAKFVSKNLSRHFTIRQDYGLFEYTVYVHRNPQ